MNPARLFWTLLALRVLVWTLVPSLLASSLPLDVIEGLAWGRQWQWGYWKHPPLAAWVVEATAAVFGTQLWPLFLVGQLAIALGLWATWKVGLELLEPAEALIATLLLDGIYYYNMAGAKPNPDLLQLALWAVWVLFLFRALKDDRPRTWAFCGLALGLSCLAKYYTLSLVVAMAAALVSTEGGRRRLLSPGPWLAALVATAVVAPHVIWLGQHGFLPLAYARQRLEGGSGLWRRLREPLFFGGGQLIIIMPTAFLFWAIGARPRPRPHLDSLRLSVLAAVTLGPFLLTMAAGALLGLTLSGASREAWGTPLWSFAGVLALVFLRPVLTPVRIRRFASAWGGVVLASVMVYAASVVVWPRFTQAGKRESFPGRELAAFVGEAWRSRFGTPLPFAAGNIWLAGNVGFLAPERPPVYIDLDPQKSAWIDETEFRRRGAVVLWDARDAEATLYRRFLRERFPRASLQPIQPFRWRSPAAPPPFLLGWAILPPEGAP